ncbi:hypothetical protein CBL_08530 [Carabus blaptoides fortunei]
MKNPFFKTLLTASDNSFAAIFVSPTVPRQLREIQPVSIHMDATFKVVPRAGGGSQLFIIHTYYEGTIYPVLYALMSRKTTEAYKSVLEYFKTEHVANLNISYLMADYETALRNVARDLFPNHQLHGCWFHYYVETDEEENVAPVEAVAPVDLVIPAPVEAVVPLEAVGPVDPVIPAPVEAVAPIVEVAPLEAVAPIAPVPDIQAGDLWDQLVQQNAVESSTDEFEDSMSLELRCSVCLVRRKRYALGCGISVLVEFVTKKVD